MHPRPLTTTDEAHEGVYAWMTSIPYFQKEMSMVSVMRLILLASRRYARRAIDPARLPTLTQKR